LRDAERRGLGRVGRIRKKRKDQIADPCIRVGLTRPKRGGGKVSKKVAKPDPKTRV